MLKILSIFGYVGMIGGLLGLLVTQHLFSSSALVISLQVAAVLLLVWARVIFGRRSFHVVADPTEGGLVTWSSVDSLPCLRAVMRVFTTQMGLVMRTVAEPEGFHQRL